MPRTKKYRYDKLFVVITRAPLLHELPDCVLASPSVQAAPETWATLVRTPNKYKVLDVLELLAYEGAYSGQFVTFVQV